jgi:hypothetical protein
MNMYTIKLFLFSLLMFPYTLLAQAAPDGEMPVPDGAMDGAAQGYGGWWWFWTILLLVIVGLIVWYVARSGRTGAGAGPAGRKPVGT